MLFTANSFYISTVASMLSAALNGEDLMALGPEERAHRGVFLAFQYPVEIPGVNNTYFLRAAANAIHRYRGEEELDAFDFMQLVRERVKVVQMDDGLLKRAPAERLGCMKLGTEGVRHAER